MYSASSVGTQCKSIYSVNFVLYLYKEIDIMAIMSSFPLVTRARDMQFSSNTQNNMSCSLFLKKAIIDPFISMNESFDWHMNFRQI